MKQLLLCILAMFSFNMFGQSIGSYSLSPAGSSSMNENGALYFSIGEPMNNEIGDGEFIIAQGFLQVAIQGILNDSQELLRATAKVYPNPVGKTLTLELQGITTENHYILYNISGEKLQRKSLATKHSSIHFESLPSGTYFLQVFTEQQSIGVYTIIKQ